DAISIPDGHVFGRIRRAKHLTVAFVGWIPAVADEECGRPLGGVIVSQNMRIGLQEESDIGVADPLADHLRAYAGFPTAALTRARIRAASRRSSVAGRGSRGPPRPMPPQSPSRAPTAQPAR